MKLVKPILGSLLVVPIGVIHTAPALCQDFYDDPYGVTVERGGRVQARLPAERIPLEYPELAARGEAYAGMSSDATIWAVISYNTGSAGTFTIGAERIFWSRDKGLSWDSRRLDLEGDEQTLAFLVLSDDTLLLLRGRAGGEKKRTHVSVFHSRDRAESWQRVSRIPAAPYANIGEGALSATQLANGNVLFPVGRWSDLELDYHHLILISTDLGKTWIEGPRTFDGVYETHLLELAPGKLLGAFRFSGPYREWHKLKARVWGAAETPDVIGRIFKHVFIADSEDGGLTWNHLGPPLDKKKHPLLIFGEAHGQLVKLSDKTVVLVSDHRYPYHRAETVAFVSFDGGRTWSPDKYHLSKGLGYPSSVALDDGTIVTVVGNTQMEPKRKDLPLRKTLEDSKPIQTWSAQVVRWRLTSAP